MKSVCLMLRIMQSMIVIKLSHCTAIPQVRCLRSIPYIYMYVLSTASGEGNVIPIICKV